MVWGIAYRVVQRLRRNRFRCRLRLVRPANERTEETRSEPHREEEAGRELRRILDRLDEAKRVVSYDISNCGGSALRLELLGESGVADLEERWLQGSRARTLPTKSTAFVGTSRMKNTNGRLTCSSSSAGGGADSPKMTAVAAAASVPDSVTSTKAS